MWRKLRWMNGDLGNFPDVAMEISKTLPELRVNNRRYLSWNRFHSPSGSWGVENRPWQTTRPNHTDRARIHWIQSLKKYNRTTACLCCWEVLSRAMTQIHRAIRCNRVHLSLVLSFRMILYVVSGNRRTRFGNITWRPGKYFRLSKIAEKIRMSVILTDFKFERQQKLTVVKAQRFSCKYG